MRREQAANARHRPVLAVAMVLGHLAASAPALAGAEGVDPPAARVVVMLVPADAAEETGPLAHVVASHLSDCDAELRLEPVAGLGGSMKERVDAAAAVAERHAALAVFWFDVVTEDQMFIYLTGSESSRILVRNLTDASADGRAEALGVIVHAAVSELLAGGEIGVRASVPPPPPPSPPPAPPAPPAPARNWLRLDLAYALRVHSTEHPAVQGFDVGLALFAHRYVALTAGYTVVSTILAHGYTSSIQVDSHPVRCGLALVIPAGPVLLGASVELTIDNTTFRNFNLAVGYEQVRDDDDVVVGLHSALLFAVPLVERLSAFVSAGAETPFNRRSYVTTSLAGTERLVAGWPVQPLLLVGLWVVLI